VKKEAAALLRKSYWGGGSVSLAAASADFHQLKGSMCERLEDGTLSFLDIVSLKHGFAFLETLGGPGAIERHTEALRR
jgi:molybdenum cofactor sulfurtransferase